MSWLAIRFTCTSWLAIRFTCFQISDFCAQCLGVLARTVSLGSAEWLISSSSSSSSLCPDSSGSSLSISSAATPSATCSDADRETSPTKSDVSPSVMRTWQFLPGPATDHKVPSRYELLHYFSFHDPMKWNEMKQSVLRLKWNEVKWNDFKFFTRACEMKLMKFHEISWSFMKKKRVPQWNAIPELSWVFPLPSHGFLRNAEVKMWKYPRKGLSFACEP